MARFEPVAAWPGSVLYRAIHGRVYCVAPRGMIPEYPYTMSTLREPTPEETYEWGPGVMPRMVVDVTNIAELSSALHDGTLPITPWGAYLVLRLPDSRVIVAYRTTSSIPRLDRIAAGQVAIGSGHDVAGWSSELIQHHGGERWQFTPPRYEPMPSPQPATAVFGS